MVAEMPAATSAAAAAAAAATPQPQALPQPQQAAAAQLHAQATPEAPAASEPNARPVPAARLAAEPTEAALLADHQGPAAGAAPAVEAQEQAPMQPAPATVLATAALQIRRRGRVARTSEQVTFGAHSNIFCGTALLAGRG